jgi:hypothetical protein
MTPMPTFKKEEGNNWIKIMDDNFNHLEKLDEKSRLEGKLEGRYINHPYADGYAYYFITKENKTTVSIQVLTGLGDDWVLPAWGKKATIAKDLAKSFVIRRDRIRELFSKKQK